MKNYSGGSIPLNKIIIAVVFLVLLAFTPKLYEDVDAGEITVIQNPFTGNLSVYTTPGPKAQWFGEVTRYRRSNTFWFLAPSEEGEANKSIAVKWNDGGHASISGSVRYDLPTDEASIIKIHSIFRGQDNLEAQLIKTNIEKAVYMTGPLMSSKESYAERRNEIIFFIEDQASKGVYRTKTVEKEIPDPLTNEMRNVSTVEIITDTNNNFKRQESSPIADLNIKLYNVAIKGIDYDQGVEKQIQTQQQAIMNVQTA